MTSVWGVCAVAILDSSLNCVCVWSTKKLNMPAYCVAANCNNSQTTQGITMHELLRNRPAVRRKWIKLIQFKPADFLAALHHAHLCSEHFSECDFANPFGHFAVTPQNDVGIWSHDLGVMATLSVQQKMPFFSCIYNPQITVSPTSSFSVSFNGNRVKNLGLVL